MATIIDKRSEKKKQTIEDIKDAFLCILKQKEYFSITITDICKKAHISRGTFYAYFKNTREIVDALFNDALRDVGNVPLDYICCHDDKERKSYPFCVFLRENIKYQPLFFSDSLYSLAIDRTVERQKERFLNIMQKETSLDKNLLEDLLHYQITGCLSVCKKYLKMDDEEWDNHRCNLDAYIRAALFGLKDK